jgi:UDP-glucose 4-epimerase
MRIFLTGGTGFIGSHFMKQALVEGHDLLALRRTAETRPKIPLSRQPRWLQKGLSELCSEDLEGCDVLVHLASAGVSPKNVPWPELVEINVIGSVELVATAREAGIRRFVVAGTCHEYGVSAQHYEAIPVEAPLEPNNLYGASKAAAYQLLAAYARVQKLELFYGRIFSAYGEGQYEGNFWPSLRQAALSGEDFPMTSGSQVRDFMPVEDVAAALLVACQRPDLRAGEPCVENIGTGRPRKLLDFAEQEWKRFGAKGRLLAGQVANRPDEVERFAPLIQQ